MCNDRCPQCFLEISPISSRDLSRQLDGNDYLLVARKMGLCGEIGIDPSVHLQPGGALVAAQVWVSEADAVQISTATLEGR
jgi:hypothetical protein